MRMVYLALTFLALSAATAYAVFDDLASCEVSKSYPKNEGRTFGAAKVDTVVIAFWDFEGKDGSLKGELAPWEPKDLNSIPSKWHVDTFRANTLGTDPPNNTQCAYAGELFTVNCGGSNEGYGNNYKEYLDWWGFVDDPNEGTTVSVQAYINTDTEPLYDHLYLQYELAGAMEILPIAATSSGGMCGINNNVFIDVAFTITSGDYINGDEVHLRWAAHSNTVKSDADCSTQGFHSNGHTQLDEISIYFDQGTGEVLQSFENFGGKFDDKQLGGWVAVPAPEMGNFAQVWDELGDNDPCYVSNTSQVAFIDDGIIVPSVGPSYNPLWIYGPNQFVTNYTHGLSGNPNVNLNNAIWSPVINLDSSQPGHEIRFTVYRHMDINGMAGQFYTWRVTSSVDGIDWDSWQNRSFVYYGGPEYYRHAETVTDLLLPGALYARIELSVVTPWADLKTGGSTPAPYYDDVSWHSYAIEGPILSYRGFELAQDNFPAELDPDDLGCPEVPFINGYDIVRSDGPGIVHGDAVIVSVASVRPGAELVAPPRMHYSVKTNPVFDYCRTSGWSYMGFVEGDSIWPDVTTNTGRWSFELPDMDYLFPGDVVHYYFSAEDAIPSQPPQTSTLPADLDGYGVFQGDSGFVPRLWPSDFTLHCLPTVQNLAGDIPGLLLWNDFEDSGSRHRWEGALNTLGFVLGVDYDIYYTNSASSGTGNGLGATCTPAILGLYDHVIYTSVDHDAYTMAGPKFGPSWSGDGSNDIALLTAYIGSGGNLFATGDNLVSDLMTEGSGFGVGFVGTELGVSYRAPDVRSKIGDQSSPRVTQVPSGSSLSLSSDYIAYGGCPDLNQFDEIIDSTAPTSYRIAEFLDKFDVPGMYPTVAALVANERPGFGKVVVSPVDYNFWYTPPKKTAAPVAMRVAVLCDILNYFAGYPQPPYCDVSAATVGEGTPRPFYAKNWPNPFNPITMIEFSLPKNGHVSLKVFNVRGNLVRTLVDETRTAGAHVVQWDGIDDRGQSVASGVYFYETRTDGKSKVNKLALVK